MAKVNSSSKSTVVTSNSENSKKEFNNWEFVKSKIVQAYLQSDRANEFEVQFKYMYETTKDFKDENGKKVHFHADGAVDVLDYYESRGAFEYSKPRKITLQEDEDNSKTVYVVKVTNFDLKHKQDKKDGSGQFYAFMSAYKEAQGYLEFYGVKA